MVSEARDYEERYASLRAKLGQSRTMSAGKGEIASSRGKQSSLDSSRYTRAFIGPRVPLPN